MNVKILTLAIRMRIVKIHKAVLRVPVMLAIMGMETGAKVKIISQFKCFFHLKILTLKNQMTNVKIVDKKKQFC